MSIEVRTRGRPLARCSVFRAASVTFGGVRNVTPSKVAQAVNSINFQVASNRHIEKCHQPWFLQSDSLYEQLVDVFDEYLTVKGPNGLRVGMDHRKDRFDCVCLDLKGAISVMNDRNKNDEEYDGYDQIALTTRTDRETILQMANLRAVPEEFAQMVCRTAEREARMASGSLTITTLDHSNRAHPPIDKRKRVVELISTE